MDSVHMRKLDDLGRVAIPKEIRNVCGWEPGDMIIAETDGDCVMLYRLKPDIGDTP